MATNYTTNYQLCQWEATDKVLRTDFNQDNQKIDAALSGLAKISAGAYTGNGAETQAITLPFTPKVVFVCTGAGEMRSVTAPAQYYGGVAVTSHPAQITHTYGTIPLVTIETNGFSVYRKSDNVGLGLWSMTNQSGVNYYYFAIG